MSRLFAYSLRLVMDLIEQDSRKLRSTEGMQSMTTSEYAMGCYLLVFDFGENVVFTFI